MTGLRIHAFPLWAALPTLTLAACTAASEPGAALHAEQEATCTAVIAAHVNRPVSALTARWLDTDPQGGSRVAVRDGGRRHICEIDANGQLRGYWEQPL